MTEYSRSKARFRHWLSDFARAHDVNVINVRLHGFYGPGPGDRSVVSWLTKQLLANAAVVPLTSGVQQRDFIYIDDAVCAMDLLLDKGLESLRAGMHQQLDVEIGSGVGVSIKALAAQLKVLTCSSAVLGLGQVPDRIGEQQRLVSKNEALSVLGWRPEVDLRCGLQRVVGFYLGESVRAFA